MLRCVHFNLERLTAATGINNATHIVGAYTDRSNNTRGFLATP
jgi:hypothetical protein